MIGVSISGTVDYSNGWYNLVDCPRYIEIYKISQSKESTYFLEEIITEKDLFLYLKQKKCFNLMISTSNKVIPFRWHRPRRNKDIYFDKKNVNKKYNFG